ncbi:MAG: hypothetical protein JW795_08585 [Chitinivibrionales bacterium]|nr:hypothetical protein [Chitinivibrionales bacterium]
MNRCIHPFSAALMKMVLPFLVLSFFLHAPALFAEKVCKFTYLKQPQRLNGKELPVPSDAVAMSEQVFVFDSKEISQVGGRSSIFFIIDNSGSMGPSANATDIQGSRFIVTRDLTTIINNKYPKCEIGIATFGEFLYFFEGDDDIFEKTADQDYGAYIPLLQLDSIYTKNRKGYEILTYFMRTTKKKQGSGGAEFEDMIYEPTWAPIKERYTNITAGFRAARSAFKKSAVPKEKQFIIFFSDGESNKPNGTDSLEYVKGLNIPTTYTIYFTTDTSKAFQNLQTMTNNIKNNGYSKTNPQSNLWSIKTSVSTLMELLQKNVLPTIFSEVTHEKPKKLVINTSATNNTWKDNSFTFQNLFPLTDFKTPFTYDLTFSVIKDSITADGDTIQKSVKDTTFTIGFIASIEQAPQQADSVKCTYWGRNVGFFHNGSAVTMITADMKEIDIQFSEYQVDVLYGYKDVEVFVMGGGGAQGCDIEKVSLTKNGTIFSKRIQRQVGTPKPNDGILQHADPDSLIVVFRNPALPLDTLRNGARFRGEDIMALQTAAFFDNTADGHIDSIACAISGPKVAEFAAAIVKVLALPSHRNLSIESHTVLSNGIGLRVKENNQKIQTVTTSADTIVIKEQIKLSDNTVLLPARIQASDSMAAVLMEVAVSDSVLHIKQAGKIISSKKLRSELFALFSEPIRTISKKNPLKYFRPSTNTRFDADLTLLKQNKTDAAFTIESVNPVESFAGNDSAWINWQFTDNIVDECTNNQDNPDNIKRLVSYHLGQDTLERPAPYKLKFKALVLDHNGDVSLPTSITAIPTITKQLKHVSKTQENSYKGIMVMTLEPDPKENVTAKDDFSAVLSLYDPLGNRFVKDLVFGKDKEQNRLIAVWDGKNSDGRQCGSSTYLARISISYFFSGKELDKERQRQFVGVKDSQP